MAVDLGLVGNHILEQFFEQGVIEIREPLQQLPACGRGFVQGNFGAGGKINALGRLVEFVVIGALRHEIDYKAPAFLGSSFAFIILAAIGIACMLASALHGPQIAALGLLASFVTPILVSSSDPNPWALTLYLAVVSAAAHGLARLRRWT